MFYWLCFTQFQFSCAYPTSSVCYATFKKSWQSRSHHCTCSPCHLNSLCLIRTCTKANKSESNLKISTMERRTDSTLYQRNIVIGMLTVGMMTMQVARYFQACECMLSSLRTKFRQTDSFKSRHHTDRPRYPTRKEDTDNITSSRRNRFLSNTRSPDLVRISREFKLVTKQFKDD